MKLADKPGSVVDSHSSRRTVTRTLKQPTRRLGEQRQNLPIWFCSGWRLLNTLVSVALFLTSRWPAINRHPALWSPDFPLPIFHY